LNDDDILLELWRRFLTDPRASDDKIRRMCIIALVDREDFPAQLIEWFLKTRAGKTRISGQL
jgi:hypothetical protein